MTYKRFQRTKKLKPGIVVFLTTVLFSSTTLAWERQEAKTFAVLPPNSTNTEALTADEQGNIYASTFLSGEIHSYDQKGDLLSTIKVSPSSGVLTDLAFHPLTHALLVNDFGAQKVLEVNPVTGSAVTFAEIPGGANAGPNVMTFDANGNVYVSDSFQATIWRIPTNGGSAQAWIKHELLTTTGHPPFGANGLGFNKDFSIMYVANTGEDSIVQIAVDENGNAGSATVLVYGINGPDGLIVDENDNILVAANQSNQIIVLNPSGNAISILGDFDGINEQGVVNGLLMPSDLVKVGNYVYVTNFALDTGIFGLIKSYSTAYTKQVRRHSISRIELEH